MQLALVNRCFYYHAPNVASNQCSANRIACVDHIFTYDIALEHSKRLANKNIARTESVITLIATNE
jgi:hypothetical protein